MSTMWFMRLYYGGVWCSGVKEEEERLRESTEMEVGKVFMKHRERLISNLKVSEALKGWDFVEHGRGSSP